MEERKDKDTTHPDADLDRLFDAYRPTLTPAAPFMDTLQRKMEAVDYVKQLQRRRIRSYRMAVLAAFVLGTLSGAIVIALQPGIGAELLARPLLSQLTPTQVTIVEMLHLRQMLVPLLCLLLGGAVIGICSLRQRNAMSQ